MNHRGYTITDFGSHCCVIPPDKHDYIQRPFATTDAAKDCIDFAIECGAPVDDQPEKSDCPTNHCDVQVCKHPRRGGFLVYCADCDLTAEGGTVREAAKNWQSGFTLTQDFDRTELVDGKSVE
jgi:hypothetical protein